MISLQTNSKLVFGVAPVLLLGVPQVLATWNHTCLNPQLSCHNTTAVQDLCCFNAPGGQLLQTQFWDSDPATGPDNSWTVHGLWPDKCDGTYDANCDPSRAYTNISSIISAFGKTDLLNFMNTYWKDYQGNDETFWEHEWEKHGTCISTYVPDCYTDHKPTEEVVDFFQKTADLFKTLPSYDWLQAAGIEPSTDKTYTTAEIQSALSAKRNGVQVTLGCKSGALNEIWYHFNVRGSTQTGDFVPANPDGTKSTCPDSGIKYLPKNGGSAAPTNTGSPQPTNTGSPQPTDTGSPQPTDTGSPQPTDTGSPQPTSTGSPGSGFSGQGYLNVVVNGATTGCIIGAGSWYTSGTCATFTATSASGGFTLKSSKGTCGVTNGVLTCGGSSSSSSRRSEGTSFSQVNGNLAVSGKSDWSADAAASGSTQQKVYAGTSHSQALTITWQSV